MLKRAIYPRELSKFEIGTSTLILNGDGHLIDDSVYELYKGFAFTGEFIASLPLITISDFKLDFLELKLSPGDKGTIFSVQGLEEVVIFDATVYLGDWNEVEKLRALRFTIKTTY